MSHDSKTQRAYFRELPGHGFVAIDVKPEPFHLWRHHYRASLIVERREPSRRAGHTPPVVAEATGDTIESVLQPLLPAAEYNPAIAAALLRLHPVHD
jgi:hypothetical protein